MRDKWEPYRIDIKYNLVDCPRADEPFEKGEKDSEEERNDISRYKKHAGVYVCVCESRLYQAIAALVVSLSGRKYWIIITRQLGNYNAV